MSEKSSEIFKNIVRNSNLHWDLRMDALEELIKRERLDILDELSRDSNLHWDLRKRAMEGIKKHGK